MPNKVLDAILFQERLPRDSLRGDLIEKLFYCLPAVFELLCCTRGLQAIFSLCGPLLRFFVPSQIATRSTP